MVFPFFPIPYHRVYVASCFFWPRIGHLEIRSVGAFLEGMSRPSPFLSLVSVPESSRTKRSNCTI